MVPLKVSFIQGPLEWHNSSANLAQFDKQIRNSPASDLWVLPEMFASGFTMQPEKVAEEMEGVSVSWMKTIATELHCAVGGSLVIKENGEFFNRFVLVKKSGEVFHYNKRHLFTLAGEQNFYSRGENKTIVSISGWKVCLQVCYDLRFPSFVRNSNDNRYDLILYVANWPVPRISAWDKLLLARAIENQCYVIGVNRTGKDANEMQYTGHSAAIDPYGEYICQAGEKDGVFTVLLDKDKLGQFREKFPVLNDADLFDIR